MPTYEYQCESCGKQFTLTQSIAEHDRRQTACPECKSDKVFQLISSFTAKTSRKS
ncbi:MAG TPA: zinc ribbon domain-containing protein [Geobacteraceae bacterium]|nr:zinc ribbon domain-containing protein [Geobacteraceae bacterium]